MDFSTLNRKIIIYKKDKNNKTIFSKKWASIKELYGKEKYFAMQAGQENTIKFILRYEKNIEQLKQNRLFEIEFNNSCYEIKRIDFNNYKKDFITIEAQELK